MLILYGTRNGVGRIANSTFYIARAPILLIRTYTENENIGYPIGVVRRNSSTFRLSFPSFDIIIKETSPYVIPFPCRYITYGQDTLQANKRRQNLDKHLRVLRSRLTFVHGCNNIIDTEHLINFVVPKSVTFKILTVSRRIYRTVYDLHRKPVENCHDWSRILFVPPSDISAVLIDRCFWKVGNALIFIVWLSWL
jgi:hypothetical protein